jgi:hypothetical protein
MISFDLTGTPLALWLTQEAAGNPLCDRDFPREVYGRRDDSERLLFLRDRERSRHDAARDRDLHDGR